VARSSLCERFEHLFAVSGCGHSRRVFSLTRNRCTCIDHVCRLITRAFEVARTSCKRYDESRAEEELIEQHRVSISFITVVKVSDVLYMPAEQLSKLSRRTDKNTSK
jgi:hypothetical protein